MVRRQGVAVLALRQPGRPLTDMNYPCGAWARRTNILYSIYKLLLSTRCIVPVRRYAPPLNAWVHVILSPIHALSSSMCAAQDRRANCARVSRSCATLTRDSWICRSLRPRHPRFPAQERSRSVSPEQQRYRMMSAFCSTVARGSTVQAMLDMLFSSKILRASSSLWNPFT